MTLPQFQSSDRNFQMMQNAWASQLDPILRNPATQSLLLKNVTLLTGTTNTINHLLGRVLQGWKIIRQRAAASIYDTQDLNASPQLTLTLITSANVVVDLEVF